MNKEEVKNKIRIFEYVVNGLRKLNGSDVKVKNLKLNKEVAVCDVELIIEDRKERYNSVEYPLSKLMALKVG